jgi:hypothetical protein
MVWLCHFCSLPRIHPHTYTSSKDLTLLAKTLISDLLREIIFFIKGYRSGLYTNKWVYTVNEYKRALRL